MYQAISRGKKNQSRVAESKNQTDRKH
jgi:hypothetical protein